MADHPLACISVELGAQTLESVFIHIAAWICVVVLLGSLAVLVTVGMRGFYSRAID